MPLGRLSAFLTLTFLVCALNAADPPYRFTHLAGAPPSLAEVTPLDGPYDVAADGSGNVYIADTFNHVIRKLSPSGELTILAGTIGSGGSADGTGSAARFVFPRGLAVDSAGTVYVADEGNDKIRRISPAGEVTTIAGRAGSPGKADGPADTARFDGPSSVALDLAGNLYVGDTGNHTIRKISPSGTVTTLAGSAGNLGHVNGTGSAAHFYFPAGVALDTAGNVYVADARNNAIRRITPAGVVTTFAGGSTLNDGSDDGLGTAARFKSPRDVAIDPSGVIYVADQENHTIRRITAAGAVTTFAGTAGASGTTDGIGTSARFNDPWGIAVDLLGNVYVADKANNAVRKITPQRLVSTVGGLAVREGSADGRGANARFHSPGGLAVDALGNVFIADTFNHTIRRVTPSGDVTTFAGTAGVAGDDNGVGAAARFYFPSDVAVDANGNLYVADDLRHTIRKITPSGEVSTYAGSPAFSGSNDGPRSQARFRFPAGVATDSLGNVYVADAGNQTIRMISASGTVSTLAGLAGSRGTANGLRSEARFDQPEDIVVDDIGNVYVSDSFNHAIRKIAPSGEVTTFAGVTGNGGSVDGNGSNARLQGPTGIAIDSSGTLYVAEAGGQIIRKITKSRDVVTIAGLSREKGNTDGTGTNARFNNPSGIAVDATGKLYVSDTDNHAIRVGVSSAAPPRRRAAGPRS